MVASMPGHDEARRPMLTGVLVTLRAAGEDDLPTITAILDEPSVAEWWRRSEWERVDERDAATFAIVWLGAGPTTAAGPVPAGSAAAGSASVSAGRVSAGSASVSASRVSAGSASGGPAAGQVVGCIQYTEELDRDYRSAAVDVFVSALAQGRGAGSDAMRTLIAWLIDVRGHHRFTVDPAAANRRAIHVYEKLGFRPVGLLREYERVVDGTWRDALLMELLAAELVRE